MYESGRRTECRLAARPSAAAFLRNYVLRRGFLDGTTGLTLSLVNAYGVFIKMAKLWERQRTGAAAAEASAPVPGSSQAP
jgi:(heptosyl)LPS beta-1,4-glucosyltransferase